MQGAEAEAWAWLKDKTRSQGSSSSSQPKDRPPPLPGPPSFAPRQAPLPRHLVLQPHRQTRRLPPSPSPAARTFLLRLRPLSKQGTDAAIPLHRRGRGARAATSLTRAPACIRQHQHLARWQTHHPWSHSLPSLPSLPSPPACLPPSIRPTIPTSLPLLRACVHTLSCQ
jgi:hypothetical protein